MAEIKFQFTGWQIILLLVVLSGVVGVRVVTLDDMKDDKDLMQRIDTLLVDEYSPYVAEKMRAAVSTGDEAKIEDSVKSVTSTKVTLISVQASYPLLNFSLPKDVVIKVVFSLDDATERGEERTIYYLFKRGVFGWQYQYITSSMRYYLNFL